MEHSCNITRFVCRNSSEMDELRKRVIENGNATIIKNYPLPQQGAKAGYSEIEQILRAVSSNVGMG